MRTIGIAFALSLAACSQGSPQGAADKPSAEEEQAIADAEAMLAEHADRIENRDEEAGAN